MYRIDNEKFGAFVSELRREKGMTQKDLAQRLFVSDKAVSKWERGQSLPDISLLMPLSQLLEVTVAELLRGERIPGEGLNNSEVESLVNKAIQLSAEEREKREKNRRFWRWGWLVCTAAATLEILLLATLNQLSPVELWDYLLLVEGLMLGFGFYFCFFVKETLPTYYDENKISVYSDGPFRMSLPGVRFNNSNWPHIVNAGRRWMLAVAVLYPPVYGLLRSQLPGQAQLFLSLAACLVIGAGNVGRRKISTLLESGAASVVALDPFVDQNELQVYLEDSRFRFERRIFKEDDAAGKNLVFVCTSSREANRKAAEACRAQNVLCNVADAPREGMFIVPSHVEAPPLTLALSTGGASPAGAAYWKGEIDRLIPRDAGELLAYLDGLRETVKGAVPSEKRRAAVFAALFDACRAEGWPLDKEKLDRLLGGGEEQ